MAIRTLITGDLHLGRSSGGVYGGQEEVSTRTTWSRLVEWAIGNDVDLIMLTGDIIDRNNRYFEAIGPLQSGFRKLNDAGIKIFMVSGNHDFDVLRQIAGGDENENVRLLGQGGMWEVATFNKNGQTIQIAGFSFPHQYIYESPVLSLNKNNFNPNSPVVGLLHCDVAARESKYGPVDPGEFYNRGVDVWALGHIHKPGIIQPDNPLVFYPGSPHAMSAKENGVHGPFLLTIESREKIIYRQIPLSPVRFEKLHIDISGAPGEEEVRQMIVKTITNDAIKLAERHPEITWLIYDVVLFGEHATPRNISEWAGSDTEDYRRELENGAFVILRKIENKVIPRVQDMEMLAGESSPAGKLAETILAIENGQSTAFLETMLFEWNRKFQLMNDSPAYTAVRNSMEPAGLKQKALDHILKECHRLLGELTQQQSSSKY